MKYGKVGLKTVMSWIRVVDVDEIGRSEVIRYPIRSLCIFSLLLMIKTSLLRGQN
jgi:hypothetical protein